MIVGIDIGTCYSTICVLNKEGKAEAVKTSTGLGLYGNDYSLPSAVFFENEKFLVGQAAYNSRMKAPENFMSEFKRDFGQTIPYHLGNQTFLPEDLYKELFVHMKICAETYTGENIEHAYVTHPSRFTEDQKKRLKQSANRAGIMNVILVEEPVAAAFHYVVENNLEEDKTLLVYDFGGGTFDVALVSFRHGEFELLSAPSGLERCGGIDVDKLIYDNILQTIPYELKEAVKVNPKLLQNFKSQVNEHSIKAKHHLSAAEEFKNEFQVIYDFVDYVLNRTDLNQLISPIVSETLHCVRTLIDRAGINSNKIDAVLLVGGSSRIPLVKDTLADLLQKPVMENVDPDLAIAMGATIWGKKLSCGYKAIKDDTSGKWGFCDSNGESVLSFIYEDAKDFTENRAAVKMNGRWGTINQTGRIITPFDYDEISSYNQGLAKARKANKYGFLNHEGKEFTAFKYTELGEFTNNLCTAKIGNMYGYVSLDGRESIPVIYNNVDQFIDGKAKVKRNNKVGYINTEGKEFIPCVFDEINDFVEGVALVKVDNRFGFISEKGKATTKIIYHTAVLVVHQMVVVSVDKKYGIIDLNDNIIIAIKYDFIYLDSILFDNNRIIVSNEEKFGVIDFNDNEIIPIRYMNISFDADNKELLVHGYNKCCTCTINGKGLLPLKILRDYNKNITQLSLIRGNTTIRDFYIGKFTITQREWKEIMGTEPYINDSYIGDNNPIIKVSWFDAVRFCNRLSEKEGLKPSYVVNGKDVNLVEDSEGYRLPTESEWTYAASGGELSKRYAGTNYKEDLKMYAWFGLQKIHPVGEKLANEFGLYDMSGNVSEWCWDNYDSFSNEKVCHGGNWLLTASNCEIQHREGMAPDKSDSYTGFRVVIVPLESS